MNKTLWRAATSAGLLVSGLLACTAPAAKDSDRAGLETAIQRWTTSVNAQDVDTLTATMTEDVELVDGAGTIKGRDAATRALRETAMRGQLVATSRELSIANDVAWRVVAFVQTARNGDVHARGQALEIWKRVQGEWQLHRRMATGLVAPEVSLTRPSTKDPVLDRPSN